MARKRLVKFEFGPESQVPLDRLRDQGRLIEPLSPDQVRSAVAFRNALRRHATEGFTHVIARNPRTHQENLVLIVLPAQPG
jgi:hypothetical protein